MAAARSWAGKDLRGAELQGADLRGADLRGADLQGADLRGADLRGADLRGADLQGADLEGSALHGADLRETRVGKSGLGHRGGDPELTFIYNPEIWAARADDETRWPAGFEVFGAGIVFDGPDVLPLEGEVVDIPSDADGGGSGWGSVSTGRYLGASDGRGRVRRVQGWLAHLETDAGRQVQVPGDRLLAGNLHLLRGQRALHRSEWWSIVGHDDDRRTLTLEHGREVDVVAATGLLRGNVNRWWWHVPGAEHTARD